MIARLNAVAGPLSFALIVLGGVFIAGARYGSSRTLEAIQARVQAAARARPAAQEATPRLGPAPENPDPRSIVSPVASAPAPAPKTGTVRRYVGDALVSEDPIQVPSAPVQAR